MSESLSSSRCIIIDANAFLNHVKHTPSFSEKLTLMCQVPPPQEASSNLQRRFEHHYR